MLIAQKNSDGTLSIADSNPSSPVMIIGEETYSNQKGDKDYLIVSAVLNSESLEETSLFFESKTIKQFITLPNTEVILCTISIEKIFSPKKIINLTYSNLCPSEISSQTYVDITKFWLSSEDNIIHSCLITKTTLDLFRITPSLFKYFDVVEKLILQI